MTMRSLASRLLWLGLACGILTLSLATLTACGGRPDEESGSSGDPTPDPSVYAGTYSGTFNGDDTGTFDATVDTSGNVTGSGTSAADGAFTLTGTVDGSGAFSATTSNGATWTGTADDVAGTVVGSWTNGANLGAFSGSLP